MTLCPRGLLRHRQLRPVLELRLSNRWAMNGQERGMVIHGFDRGRPEGKPKFEVMACIAGRRFGRRRADLGKLIVAARGKVLTLQNLNRLIDSISLRDFRTIQDPLRIRSKPSGHRRTAQTPLSARVPWMYDQWVCTIFQAPSILANTSEQFQGVRVLTEPSGLRTVERKR